MPDVPAAVAVVPTETNPRAAGPDTSEHGFAYWATVFSTIITTLGIVLAAVATVLTSLQTVFPAAAWIAIALTIVSGVAGVVGTAAKWTTARSAVKVSIENTLAAQALAVYDRPTNPAPGTRYQPSP